MLSFFNQLNPKQHSEHKIRTSQISRKTQSVRIKSSFICHENGLNFDVNPLASNNLFPFPEQKVLSFHNKSLTTKNFGLFCYFIFLFFLLSATKHSLKNTPESASFYLKTKRSLSESSISLYGRRQETRMS